MEAPPVADARRHSEGGSSGSGLVRAAAQKKQKTKVPEPPSEEAEDFSEDSQGCPVNLHKLDLKIIHDFGEWTGQVKEIFKQNATFGDLGRHLWEVFNVMPTPLGNFLRSFCCANPSPKRVIRCHNMETSCPYPLRVLTPRSLESPQRTLTGSEWWLLQLTSTTVLGGQSLCARPSRE